jgi:hypothetical protein
MALAIGSCESGGQALSVSPFNNPFAALKKLRKN